MPGFSGSCSQQLGSQTIVPVPDRTDHMISVRTTVDAMRSFCTISLTVLIGLPSSGNVHAAAMYPDGNQYGAMVMGLPSAATAQNLPWCTDESTRVITLPDPPPQNSPGGYFQTVSSGTIANGITYPITPTDLADGRVPGMTFLVDPSTAINAINTGRQREDSSLPWLTG